MRRSATTACPSAASVGASTMATSTASMSVRWPSTANAVRQPATIVSGRPIASRRRGRTYSRRSTPRSIRDASEKSTTVSVASPTQRTDSLLIVGSSHPRPWVLATMPPTTKTIAGVITDPSRRRETAAYASTSSAIATRPGPPNLQPPPSEHSAARTLRKNDDRARTSFTSINNASNARASESSTAQELPLEQLERDVATAACTEGQLEPQPRDAVECVGGGLVAYTHGSQADCGRDRFDGVTRLACRAAIEEVGVHPVEDGIREGLPA